ncbi:single-stranded DNA-binding protein [Kribbella solani]|uniref:Single-stranded DNA-binding protein n=1 Tax=Kribbella solani TaxID=236067 RepID=A0A841DM66_9ACTN|nr:single-stranded DNA-binding protein [Kribbella solani]MBB5979753.1 single-strand DNA-binding protein [Kribbella solani]MDX3004758.1 single-stranded DNA-binding protein [Kribbella solani]
MSLGETYLTVLGWVGSDPDFKEYRKNSQTTFRLGSTPRQFDKALNQYVDKATTWYTVQCWRSLARNAFESVRRGQPLIVTGRLRTHEWTDDAGEQRSRVILEAFSLGHDLVRGTAAFTRSVSRAEAPAFAHADSETTPAETTATPFPPDEYSVPPLPLPATVDPEVRAA